MKRLVSILALSAALSACVTVTPQAQRIQVHPANSVALQSCQKVGPVKAEVSGWGKWTYDQMNQQAEADLRNIVATQYGDKADSVMLLGVETFTNSAVANGIAYKCF
jgi:hypothetical protein